jgi:hypothetical protein
VVLPAGHHGSDHETDDPQDEAEDEPPAEASAFLCRIIPAISPKKRPAINA